MGRRWSHHHIGPHEWRLREGRVDGRMHVRIEPAVLHVTDHTDDRSPVARVLGIDDPDPTSDRVASGETVLASVWLISTTGWPGPCRSAERRGRCSTGVRSASNTAGVAAMNSAPSSSGVSFRPSTSKRVPRCGVTVGNPVAAPADATPGSDDSRSISAAVARPRAAASGSLTSCALKDSTWSGSNPGFRVVSVTKLRTSSPAPMTTTTARPTSTTTIPLRSFRWRAPPATPRPPSLQRGHAARACSAGATPKNSWSRA